MLKHNKPISTLIMNNSFYNMHNVETQ